MSGKILKVFLSMCMVVFCQANSALAQERPDIELIRIESRPSKPAAGSPVSLQFGVRNSGAAKTGPFQVTLSLYGRKVKTWDVENLIPAGKKLLEYAFTPIGTMPVKVLLIADPYGAVQESSESNNLQRLEIQVSKPFRPDIKLQRIEVKPREPRAESPLYMQCRVWNAGQADTDPFRVVLSINGREVKAFDVGHMGPGGAKTLKYDYTPSTPGTEILMMIADANNAVNESNESNNLQRREIQVSPPRQPDIELTEIRCYPDEPVAGSPINLLFNVKNNGKVKVGPFRVVMSINGREGKTWDLDGLINVHRLGFHYTPAAPGTLKVMVIADANNSIKESNESNNLQLTTIQVK